MASQLISWHCRVWNQMNWRLITSGLVRWQTTLLSTHAHVIWACTFTYYGGNCTTFTISISTTTSRRKIICFRLYGCSALFRILYWQKIVADNKYIDNVWMLFHLFRPSIPSQSIRLVVTKMKWMTRRTWKLSTQTVDISIQHHKPHRLHTYHFDISFRYMRVV